jgi:hypothetical protein
VSNQSDQRISCNSTCVDITITGSTINVLSSGTRFVILRYNLSLNCYLTDATNYLVWNGTQLCVDKEGLILVNVNSFFQYYGFGCSLFLN